MGGNAQAQAQASYVAGSPVPLPLPPAHARGWTTKASVSIERYELTLQSAKVARVALRWPRANDSLTSRLLDAASLTHCGCEATKTSKLAATS